MDRPTASAYTTPGPTGDIGADSSQSTLAAITLSGASIVGATSYAWTAEVLKPQDATYTSTAAPASASSQSTTLTPDGPGDWRLKCVATNTAGSTTFERQVSVTRPYPAPSSTLGASVYMAAGSYAPTLSDTGGADGVTWSTSAWKVSDGSSVSVTSSTSTTPSFTVAASTSYRVRHRATDAYGRVVDYAATVQGQANPALVSGGNLAAEQLAAGTTSKAIVFNAATGGVPAISYGLVLEQTTSGASLSTATGLSVTINGLTDGNVVRVTCTATDAASQTATANYVAGVAVAPVLAERRQGDVLARGARRRQVRRAFGARRWRHALPPVRWNRVAWP